MTQERSRQIGRLLMAAAIAQLLIFLVGAVRRSYLAIAVPVGVGLGVVAGLTFWVGYTMATTNWDNPADYGIDEATGEAAEAAEAADQTAMQDPTRL